MVCLADVCNYDKTLLVDDKVSRAHLHSECVCEWLFACELSALGLDDVSVAHCVHTRADNYTEWKTGQRVGGDCVPLHFLHRVPNLVSSPNSESGLTVGHFQTIVCWRASCASTRRCRARSRRCSAIGSAPT